MHKSEVPLFMLEETANRGLVWTRYGNSSGFAWAVVAVLQFDKDGDLYDWAAYLGGCDMVAKERDAVQWVGMHGNKMGRADAAYFFPDLPVALYRR